LPVWADPNRIQQVSKINSFYRENQLEGKFVVVYAGTLGYTSALEDFLHASCLLVKDTAIQILIIGEGVKKRQLELLAQGISNIRFLPFQPKERYPEVLAVADLCLVSLNPDSASYSLPSKIFNIMAAGKPILGLMPEQSDAARLIEEEGCGIVIPPDQIEQIVTTIKYLKQNPDLLSKMGGNGRRLLETSFSRNFCIDRYEKLLINTLQKS
jgi:colanic acid biosynthesis glycosyl transferase WcaI